MDCGALGSAAAVHGSRGERPGRVVEELRRVGVRNPVFVLDEVDRLDESGGASAALLEVVDPRRGAAFRDRYLDLPVDLSEQVLRVGGIGEKVLAAHRGGLAGVILPRGNQREVDEDLSAELRRAVEVHYVTRVDELLELALEPASSSAAPAGGVS